ncbi:MAG TPA: PKD domain-containing protein [Pyrinomonadaceae bacterium]
MRRQARFLLPLLCLVVLCEAVGSQQQPPTVNLRSSSVVSPPGTPQVRVRADKQRVPLGTRVTFTLSPASVVTDYVVTLYFGDRQRQVMTSPQATHVYQAVGNYTYSVDVKPRQRCQPRVTLSASAGSVPEGEAVTFSAQLSENCPNIQYRFVFGDGSSSSWQSSAGAQHSYRPAGKYLAYVDIRDGNSRIGGSPRKLIDVTRRGPVVDPRTNVSVSLTAEPFPARTGKPVTFTAKASPARADARYLFIFGDGRQTPWQTDPQSTHTYRAGGVYRPYVQVSQFINNQTVSAKSAPAVLRVQRAPDPKPDPGPTPTPGPGPGPSPTPVASPTASGTPAPSPGNGSPSPGNGSPSPAPSATGSNGTTGTEGGESSSSPSVTLTSNDGASDNKWWYLLIAAVVLFLIYQASGLVFATRPTFAPFADQGVAAVAHKKGAVPIDFELVLDSNVSGGDYSVTTDQPRLITNRSEPEDRQIIEI